MVKRTVLLFCIWRVELAAHFTYKSTFLTPNYKFDMKKPADR
jgi:hypothetical protein